MFDKFRYNGKFQLLIDGTGLVSFNYKHCDHCLVKKHSDGHMTYEHQVLEAKLVFDSLNINSLFKKNRVPQARVLYFMLALSMTYLVTNFIWDFFTVSKIFISYATKC